MSKTAKRSSSALNKARAGKSAPTQDEIARRAYEIYLERGGAPGDALQDWTRAESELMVKTGKPRGKLGPTLVAA